MTDHILYIISIIAALTSVGAALWSYRDVRRVLKRVRELETAREVTFEITKRDGDVRQVTVEPDNYASVQRFLRAVGDSEPVTQ